MHMLTFTSERAKKKKKKKKIQHLHNESYKTKRLFGLGSSTVFFQKIVKRQSYLAPGDWKFLIQELHKTNLP